MKIRLYDHPFVVVEPKVFEANSLGEWLLSHYGSNPSVGIQIFAGEPCSENEITGDVHAIIACRADECVILQSPGLPVLAWWAWGLIAVAFVVAVSVLMPKPSMPGNVNRSQQSPNNALGSRENKVRMLERVEDIYGTVKSIPSLMMPTYIKYIGHRKYEYGYYCVGRGYHDIAELCDGDTLIADIDGASAAVYDPFKSPNSGHAPLSRVGDAIIDKILTTTRAIEVDGITLKAANQIQLPATAVYSFTPDATGGIMTQAVKKPNLNSICTAGDDILVSMTPQAFVTTPASITVNGAAKTFTDPSAVAFVNVSVGNTVTMSGFATPANNGSFLVSVKTPTSITVSTGSPVTESVAAPTVSVSKDYSGTYRVLSSDDGLVKFTPASTALWTVAMPSKSCSVQLANKTGYTAWVTLPDADRTEVWCNVIASNGMFKDSSGKSGALVNFTIEIEKLTALLAPTGIVESVSGSLSGATADERAVTIERATAWVGAARVRMIRTTDFDFSFNGQVQDEIKWGDLYSVSPVSKSEFGNKTTIHTITQATARATSVKSRQLNCIASRRLPTYNGATFSGALDSAGRHVSGTISATSKIADIIAAVSIDPKIGGRDLATEVDMAQIWSVQQLIDTWNVECGQFNFTFDSDNTSFEETIINIANAGFCIAYRQNGKIRLAFDRAQTASTALFTHRNKKPKSETVTRKFASDAEYDGVEFVYVDPDSNHSETITLPLSGAYTKLKKFEIAGIRSFSQAWLRANREYQKLIGQRITIETVTTLDARALLPNSRIDIVDNTRFKSYDGEVIAQNGLELTLSQPVKFTPSASHSVVLMRRDGSLQSIAVTAGSEENKVILQSLPSESIVTSFGEDGIRTIFSFAADSVRGSMAYLVQEVDISDGQYVTVRAVNYSDQYFASDYLAIPAKDAIIN